MLGEQTPQPPQEPVAPTPVTSEDTTPPSVVEVGFYRNAQVSNPITSEAVHAGDTIYTKVVFSKPIKDAA